jgi:hypothetical protein
MLFRYSFFLAGCCLLLAATMPVNSWAAEKAASYKDIYLTENRVCKDCTWEWANKKQVKLINRAGQATLVLPKEILGIDTHPIIRRLTLKSIHGVGKAGPEIVPAAFDNANDIVCKYCDAVGR